MIITLKHVEFSPKMSKETNCFSADVYLDGVKAGRVANHGTGGSNEYDPWALADRLTEFAKTQPDTVLTWPGQPDMTLACDADMLINVAFEDWLLRSDLKKALAAGILFTKKTTNGLFSMRRRKGQSALADAQRMSVDTVFMSENDVDKLLNLLPFDDAVKLYRQLKETKAV